MGKQAQANAQRAALANALNTSGVAKAAPPVKEAPKPEKPAAPRERRPKEAPQPEQRKSKKELEEERRQQQEEAERTKELWYATEAAKKAVERKGAEQAVTYVEDKDSRKPKAVNDISEYWKAELGMLPFMPSDNVGVMDAGDDLDPHDRLEYLNMFAEQLQKLLRLRFNIFWSQMIYDERVRICIDSYLRFCVRRHDVDNDEGAELGAAMADEDENEVTRTISRRMLALLVRLSRPQETSHDFISEDKWAQIIYDHGIFDVPKLIDICAIYGDSNRTTVTKIVHSVFARQPLYKDEFAEVVKHVLAGLRQCVQPLQDSNPSRDGLSVEECVAFLPDILTCFNAMFCFFPEDCVEQLISGKDAGGGGAKGSSSKAEDGEDSSGSLPLADVMVQLHDALLALKKRLPDEVSEKVVDNVVTLLSRLLGLVLGFRMAPRRGAKAFQELLDWLGIQADRGALLKDLGQYGLESTAMEWLASGLVDDAQLDFLEELCGGPVLPPGERKRGRKAAAAPAASSSGGGGGAASSSSKAPSGPASSTGGGAGDAAKIREVREVAGMEYGEGFVLQCLLHYGGSVPAVVGAIFDGSLPPQIANLPRGMSMTEAFSQSSAPDVAKAPQLERGLSSEDKRRIIEQAQEMSQIKEADLYDDDADEDAITAPALRAGAGSDSEASDGEEGEASEEDGDQPRGKGKGKGKGKGRGPVQGQTIGARRKEENKGRIGNHNRRDGALRKMQRGM